MSDYLQRLAARSRGSQVSGIRPAPSHPVIWGAASDTPMQAGERTNPYDSRPQAPPPESPREGKVKRHLASSAAAERSPAASSAPKPADIDEPPSAPKRATSVTPEPQSISISAPSIDIMRQPDGKTQHTQPASESKAEPGQKPCPQEASSVTPTRPPAPTPLRSLREDATTAKNAPPAPMVEISIGTIEVGILTPPSSATPAPPKRRQSTAIRLSLNDYLQRRNRAAGGGLA